MNFRYDFLCKSEEGIFSKNHYKLWNNDNSEPIIEVWSWSYKWNVWITHFVIPAHPSVFYFSVYKHTHVFEIYKLN